MDFKTTLKIILNSFRKAKIQYAVIGGFGLGVLGVPRTTIDLDFIVLVDDMEKVDEIMKKNNYDCVYKDENVSQYISALKIFGEVDFLHAFRKISKSMLNRAIEKNIFNGELRIKVLRPEDIIGLKLQALINDKSRIKQEYLDIEALMEYYKGSMNWKIIEEYFNIFKLNKNFKELKKKYGSSNY